MTSPLRLAILGCGAITRSEHLAAVTAHRGVQLVALVDADLARANALIQNRGLTCKAMSDYRELSGQVDAVINALPNHLHLAVNRECLQAGLHVLCEKPLATTSTDARVSAELAEQRKRVLAVGMNRRFAASHPLLKLVMQQGLLGSIESYDFQYGGAFDWRSASGFYFDRAKAGGGALVDFGVHMLDSVIDWFGAVSAFDYQDDDWGSGVEANVLLDVTHDGSYGAVKGHLRLSRTFALKNRLLVHGTEATAEISVQDPEVVVFRRMLGGNPISQTLRLDNIPPGSSYLRQLDNFVNSVSSGSKPEVDGWQAARVLELTENCYANKRRIAEPWAEVTPALTEART